MKKQTLIIILLAVLAVSLSACENVDLSKVSKEDVNKVIVCEAPYIRFASTCCLDQNNNKICDQDETQAQQIESEKNISQPAISQKENIVPSPVGTDLTTFQNNVQYNRDCSLEYAVSWNKDRSKGTCSISGSQISVTIFNSAQNSKTAGILFQITVADGSTKLFKGQPPTQGDSKIYSFETPNIRTMVAMPLSDDATACLNQRLLVIKDGVCVI